MQRPHALRIALSKTELETLDRLAKEHHRSRGQFVRYLLHLMIDAEADVSAYFAKREKESDATLPQLQPDQAREP